MTSAQLKRRIELLLELSQGITIKELETARPFALASLWRDSLRLVHQAEELRSGIELAMTYLEDGAPQTALEKLRGALEAPEVDASDLAQPQDSVTVVLTPAARQTIEAIGRDGESDDQTIARILETIAPETFTGLVDGHAALLAGMEAIEAHHIEQNRIKDRDESHSRTLRIARAAIAKARGTI